jgi:hypothetical protein
MKRIFLSALLGLLSAPLLAQPQLDPVIVSGKIEKITLPEKPYKLSQMELTALAGQYDLVNGKTLTLSGNGPKLYAEIDGLAKAELVAAAPDLLVAKNKQIRIDFNQFANGVVGDVSVTYVAPQEIKGRRRAK